MLYFGCISLFALVFWLVNAVTGVPNDDDHHNHHDPDKPNKMYNFFNFFNVFNFTKVRKYLISGSNKKKIKSKDIQVVAATKIEEETTSLLEKGENKSEQNDESTQTNQGWLFKYVRVQLLMEIFAFTNLSSQR